MDRRPTAVSRPRPLDHGDPRTPMAWQHRNINYQQQHVYNEQLRLSTYHLRGNRNHVWTKPKAHYQCHKVLY